MHPYDWGGKAKLEVWLFFYMAEPIHTIMKKKKEGGSYLCKSVTPGNKKKHVKVNNQRKNGVAVDTAEQRGAQRPSADCLSTEFDDMSPRTK